MKIHASTSRSEMLSEQLEEIEHRLLRAIGSEGAAALQTAASSFQQLERSCMGLRTSILADPSEHSRLTACLHRMKGLAVCFTNFEHDLIESTQHLDTQMQRLVKTDWQEACANRRSGFDDNSREGENKSEQVLNSSGMRQWMLEHIAHPFPTSADKQRIVDNTNASGLGSKGELTAGQVSDEEETRVRRAVLTRSPVPFLR